MSEIKLQSDIVRKFSELYPNKRGQLFHVPNERNNLTQVFQAKAIGIFSGVSDLIYLDNIIVGIELKEMESRHKVSHILQQLEWGEIIESKGHIWRLCRTIDEAISCTEHNYKGLTINQVKRMLAENGNKKTLKF